MRRHKPMNLEDRIFYLCFWFIAAICLLVLLASCSAAVPVETPPTGVVTVTPDRQEAALRKIASSPTPTTCTVHTGIADGSLNMRSGPSTEYAVVRVLKEGEILIVSKPGTWLEVSDSEGNLGYVNARFCRLAHGADH